MADWFIKLRSDPQRARMRLFLLHYAGGSATIFNGWEKYFRSDIDVFAIQLPGRDLRFGEPSISEMDLVLKSLVDEITPYLDLPCVFFGHSMGALIAYELVRKLESGFSKQIAHLVLSGLRAPHLPEVRPPIYNLPYEEMIEVLKEYSSAQVDILNDPEIMRNFMPMLRADFSICDTYNFGFSKKIDCAVTLLSGTNDYFAPVEDAPAWQSLVVQPITYFELDGGHFFIRDHQDECLNILCEILAKELGVCFSKLENIALHKCIVRENVF